MKTAIALILLIHGLIHLLGFLKAFELAKIEELTQPISKQAGIFWLLAFLIYISISVLYLADIRLWIWAGFLGIILSQSLILQAWKDAKFGTIPNLILAALIAFSF